MVSSGRHGGNLYLCNVNQNGLCDDAEADSEVCNNKNESIMIKYILKKNMNKTSSAYGKWYAYPVVRALKKSPFLRTKTEKCYDL